MPHPFPKRVSIPSNIPEDTFRSRNDGRVRKVPTHHGKPSWASYVRSPSGIGCIALLSQKQDWIMADDTLGFELLSEMFDSNTTFGEGDWRSGG